MKDYKRLTERDEFDNADIIGLDNNELASNLDFDGLNKLTSALNRLAELEDKIERGEIDYVADSKTEQTITDLLIEFDEMGFAPTTVCPNAEQYAIDWSDQVRKEFARLTEQAKQAVETLARSFTRMETLYKVKCAEIEAKEEEISDLKAETAELKKRLENAVELPSVRRDCELTQIVYKNNYGNIEEETYFHDCYYGQGHDVRGDVYAEARLAELKGGRE